jgi:hypothetical protein
MTAHHKHLLMTTGLGLAFIGALALWPINRQAPAAPAARAAALSVAPPATGSVASVASAVAVPAADVPAAASLPPAVAALPPVAGAEPSATAVDRLVAGAEEIARHEASAAAGEPVRRQRLVRTPDFKYPDVLVEETVTSGDDRRG